MRSVRGKMCRIVDIEIIEISKLDDLNRPWLKWGSLFANTSRLLLAMKSAVVSAVIETPVDALEKGDRR